MQFRFWEDSLTWFGTNGPNDGHADRFRQTGAESGRPDQNSELRGTIKKAGATPTRKAYEDMRSQWRTAARRRDCTLRADSIRCREATAASDSVTPSWRSHERDHRQARASV